MRTAAGDVIKVMVCLHDAAADGAEVVVSRSHIRYAHQFGCKYAQRTQALELVMP